MPHPTDKASIIAATRQWISTVIVKYNFCPFARKELEADTIRYEVVDTPSFNEVVQSVTEQCIWLDNHPDTATTLLMLANGFDDFGVYLDIVDMAQAQVIDPQYQGIYQLASFHPDYCFGDSDEDDAANYTNRAPYPTIHLIREADITLALEDYPAPEQIPQNNIDLARRKGQAKLAALLAACLRHSSS
ncbi:MAG: hypothetical protein ACI8WB_002875 [Phenylobacterium sp.]|jgi:hypothetical protein